jgi:hypothetical protein
MLDLILVVIAKFLSYLALVLILGLWSLVVIAILANIYKLVI